MRPWVVAFAALVGACTSAPTLHVEVANPDGLSIARTVVSIYESTTLSCQAIEYGDVTGAELDGAQVASETLPAMGAPQGSLDDLSRTDPKLVVARAYGSDGSLLAAGCTEKDEVVGADTVTVTTEPAAIASVGLADPDAMTDPYGVEVDLLGANGAALENRPVWWRVWGPTGTQPYQSANVTTTIDDVPQDGSWQPTLPSCEQGGSVVVHPVPPDLVSGYAIQARVAWAAQQPPPITTLTTLDVSTTTLAPPGASKSKFCAIGRDATGAAIVCLEKDPMTPGAVDANAYRVSAAGGLAKQQVMMFSSAAAQPFAVFSLLDGSGTDVYAALPSGAPVRVFGPGTNTTLPCTGCELLTFDDVLAVPACTSDPDPLVLFHDPAGVGPAKQLHLVAVDGTSGTARAVTLPSDLTLDSAGCVSRAGGSPTQLFTLDSTGVLASSGNPQSIALSGCAPTQTGPLACAIARLPAAGAPVGFTGGAAPDAVAAGVDPTGVVLLDLVLDPDGRLVEVAREPAVSIPHRIVAGQFDTDGATDLAFDVQNLAAGSLLDVTYARTVEGEPLAALVPLRERTAHLPVTVTDLLTADLDGNGVDDLVVVGTVLGAYGLSVELLGVPETPVQVPFPTDANTCPP